MATRAIRGNIVLPTEILEDGVVLIEGNKIRFVGSPDHIGEDVQVLNLFGHFICPGFIDIHVHGASGADYMDGDTAAVRKVNAAHARHGTTSIYPTTTTGSFSELDAMIKACESVQETWTVADGARIQGVHFYGPYFAADKVGVHAAEGRRDPARDEYEYFLSRPIVRIATCAAELPGANEFYQYAHARGCLVTCGHSNACWSELDAAFHEGVRHVDHFWCAMSSVSSLRKRFGDPMQASMEQFVLQNEEMSTEVIADGIHLSDDLLRFAYEMIGPRRTCLVTDANRAMDAPPGEYVFGPAGSGTVVFSDGMSVRGADGGLASSMHGMDVMVRTMAKAVGRNLHSVIRMATLTPAELVGIDGEFGSIAVGKKADIVVLDRSLEVCVVIIDGEFYFSKNNADLKGF